jgi:UDP-glucuronate 4-epimerase
VRYAVTGAAGFIGSHLVERLVRDGHDVVGLDNLTDYYDPKLKISNLTEAAESGRFSLIEADLTSADLAEILSDVGGVFHLAGQPGVRKSWDNFGPYVSCNVVATHRVMDAVRLRPVPVVFASSSSVYGDAARLPVREEDPTHPISPYGVTKLAAEHVATLFGAAHHIPVVALRYFTVYGPRQRPDMAFFRFIDAALSGRPIFVLGDGSQTRDFTYVRDAVEATARAIEAPPGVYNIGGGSRASINEVLEIMEDLSIGPLDVRRTPRAKGDAMHTWADTERARAGLGWEPKTGLREGLLAQFRWMVDSRPEDRAG